MDRTKTVSGLVGSQTCTRYTKIVGCSVWTKNLKGHNYMYIYKTGCACALAGEYPCTHKVILKPGANLCGCAMAHEFSYTYKVILEQWVNQNVHSHNRRLLVDVRSNTWAGGKLMCASAMLKSTHVRTGWYSNGGLLWDCVHVYYVLDLVDC